jgi:hypothetical protein
MGKVFHVYCNGYAGVFTSAAEAQAYIDILRTKGCVGHEIAVNVGHGTKEAALYDRKRERREILRAA